MAAILQNANEDKRCKVQILIFKEKALKLKNLWEALVFANLNKLSLRPTQT